MATQPSMRKRGAGRPLPEPEPETLRRPHRIGGMGEIAALLRAERAARGLSQADMAALLGLTRQSLMALEGGTTRMAAGMVLQILADLGIVLVAFPAASDPAASLGLSGEAA